MSSHRVEADAVDQGEVPAVGGTNAAIPCSCCPDEIQSIVNGHYVVVESPYRRHPDSVLQEGDGLKHYVIELVAQTVDVQVVYSRQPPQLLRYRELDAPTLGALVNCAQPLR